MSDQIGNSCLRCNATITDQEFDRQLVAICDGCRPVYFQLPASQRLTAYVDDRRPDGVEIVELLSTTGYNFTIVPMSGVPEVTSGLARYVGLSEIQRLVETLRLGVNHAS